MAYLVNEPADTSLAEQRSRFQAYRSYIQSARERMPVAAFEFALAEWHYDYTDHRSPHDAWVEKLTIVEPSSGQRHEVRALSIELELLGAYHDGRIRLTYPGVRRYSLFQPCERVQGPVESIGHGDWLVDELSPSDNGRPGRPLVVHEIVFSRQGVWTIEAADVIYEWIPGAP